MMLVAILTAVGVIGVIVWLVTRTARRVRVNSPERQLARMLDPETAARLIRWELLRDPALSREQAAKRALERAEYDRGR